MIDHLALSSVCPSASPRLSTSTLTAILVGSFSATFLHQYNSCGSRELKTQIIPEVEVEKMAIEVDVQMRDVASGTRARVVYHRVEEQKSFLSVFVRAE